MRRVVVDGCGLEYRRHSPTADGAPTLIFLHEGLGCVELWKDFPQRVAAASGCGALVYSRAGYGGSDPVPLPRPLRYMHREGLDVLPRLLDALALQRVILVGHSDGGSISLIHAGGAADQRLLGVVTLAAHVFNEEICVASIREARTAYQAGDLRDALARYHGDVDCAFWGWNKAWLDPDFMRWNIEEYLPGIRVPLLAMQGEQDEYGSAAQLNAIAAGAGGPVQTRLLPDCRHSPHRDQPQMALDAIAAFVSDCHR